MTPEIQQETERRLREVALCRQSLAHFCSHCKILASSDRSGQWLPFHLWPAQQEVASDLETHREIVALKARQLGFTWILIAEALRQLLFFPGATVLLFSKRDDEAEELLAFRLREMLRRLPDFLQPSKLVTDTQHEIELANGSRALAFSTEGGRSYTANLAIVDEADHVPNLQAMLNAIKPTVDNGGRLVLLSTVDKSQPESTFKRIYRAARTKENSYHPIFHGWKAAPWRDEQWYEDRRRTILAQTGALDDLQQEYPATDAEALAARSLDKRIPGAWLSQCYVERPPLENVDGCPAIPRLVVYVKPRPGRRYVIGADPAEGNPTSDDSALIVLDAENGEEAATLRGKFEPNTFASHAHRIALWFSYGAIMAERNNHGCLVIARLRDYGDELRTFNGREIRLLCGHDGKTGWMTSTLGKTMLWDNTCDAFKNKETLLHSFAVLSQLSSIDGSTQRAPKGQFDDLAIAYALALCARLKLGPEPTGEAIPVALFEGMQFCGVGNGWPANSRGARTGEEKWW